MKSLTRIALARFVEGCATLLSWLLGSLYGIGFLAMALKSPELTIFQRCVWGLVTWGIAMLGTILALNAAARVDDALEDTALGASEAPGVMTIFIILALTLISIVLFESVTQLHVFTPR